LIKLDNEEEMMTVDNQPLEAKEAVLKTISLEKKQELHHMAYVYYQNKYYAEADAFFRLLLQIDPQNISYLQGLGASLKMQQNYAEAAYCYIEALKQPLQEIDPYLYVHLSDCYLALKEFDKAFAILKEAKKRAKQVNNKKVCRHVSFMYERWKKNKQPKTNA